MIAFLLIVDPLLCNISIFIHGKILFFSPTKEILTIYGQGRVRIASFLQRKSMKMAFTTRFQENSFKALTLISIPEV